MAKPNHINLLGGGVDESPLGATVLAPIQRLRKNLAFTLAEVLITLGIIGIVAAMVIPSLISNYQERYTVTRLRKTYAILQQAVKLSVSDNGEPGGWSFSHTANAAGANQAAAYIVPYMKIAKNCGTNSGCFGYTKNVKYLNGTNHTVNYDTNNRYYKFILMDGSYIGLRSTGMSTDDPNLKIWFFTDINGAKSPNTIGKDIFTFTIISDSLLPSGYDGDYSECKKDAKGWGCADYIIKYGKMDYLK